MKLYWKNRELDEVDVLCDSVLKAYITFDKEIAVIMDRDCERDFVEITENIEEIDSKKDWFEIKFSPERIICGMDFLFMSPGDKEEVVDAVAEFKITFLRTVIEVAKKKGDLVRAEVIRIVWKRFNTDGSIHSIECNMDEVQKFLVALDKEKRGKQVKGVISSTWKEIIELIIKYAVYLVQWEKGKGQYRYAASDSEWDKENSDSPENTNLKMRLGRNFRRYYEEIAGPNSMMYEVTLKTEKMLYENLRLSWDKEVDDFRRFFYKQHKSNGTSEKGKNNTTLIGYYAIKKIHECVRENKSKGKNVYFNVTLGVEGFADEADEVCNYLSSGIELVMMNIVQINFERGFMGKKSEERRSFLRDLDMLQFRIMPFVYVSSRKENKSISLADISVLKNEAEDKQKQMLDKLWKRDVYDVLGGRDMFSGLGRIGNKITLMDEDKKVDNIVKQRARKTYWEGRCSQLKGIEYKENAEIFELNRMDALDCAIAQRFNNYVLIQKEGIGWGIKTIVEFWGSTKMSE